MLRRELFTQAIEWSPLLAAAWIALQEERKKNSDKTQFSWQDKSSLDRIRILESGKKPSGIDVKQELILATAQIGCPTFGCKLSPEEIAANTFFYDSDRFADAIEQYVGRTMSAENREMFKSSGIEAVTKEASPRQVLFNEPRFLGYSKELRQYMEANPNKYSPILKLDAEVFARKCVLFHAQAHLVETIRPLPVTPLPLITQNVRQLDRLQGYTFRGLTTDGMSIPFGGASEAMTDIAGSIVARGSGYYAFTPYYYDGVRIIQHLNDRVGISDQEFINYYTGEKPQEELLERWGKGSNRKASDLDMGTYALYVAALVNHTDPLMSMDQAMTALTSTGFITP